MTCPLKTLCLLGTACILAALITPTCGVVAHEWCRFNDTQEGRCLTEGECSDNHPKGPPDPAVPCGYEKDVRLVCCPLLKVSSQLQKNPMVDDPTEPGKEAKKWCNYYKTACTTKRKYAEPRSEEENELALENEFPHMAIIGYGERDSINWECGGSLISENFVLTAAHCLQYGSFPAAWVKLGTVKTTNYMDNGEGQIHPIISRILHPEFKASSKYYDIALLKIGSSLGTDALPLMSKGIHPACLQVKEEEISSAIVTGWGSIGHGYDEKLYLQKLSTNIYDNSQCNKTFHTEIQQTQQLLRGIDESMICAKSIATCKGDSGGSLQIVKDKASCSHEIIGVTSFAKSCGLQKSTAVYSRVLYYLKWIEDQVWRGREICSLTDGQYGECKLTKDCNHAISLIAEGKKPVNCGFEMKEPIVCCPFASEEDETLSTVSRIGSVSQQQMESVLPGKKARKACNKYKSVCKSGSYDSQHSPHLALIGYGEISDILWSCSGSLISEDFVLIAAHCITDIEKKTAKWVRLGSYLAESTSRKSSNGSVIGQIHPILNIIPYPEYTEGSLVNDLALLKIGVAVEPGSLPTLSSSIHPTCLQTSRNAITEAIGLGISEIGTGDHLPLTIQKANLEVITDLKCNALSTINKHNNEEEELCLCTQVTSRERFLCTFNSEGPLLVPSREGSCQQNVAGVLVQGQLCGYRNATIIYTKIYPYLKWIEDNVWP